MRLGMLMTLVVSLAASLGLFLFTEGVLNRSRIIEFNPANEILPLSSQTSSQVTVSGSGGPAFEFATATEEVTAEPQVRLGKYTDIEPQKPLSNPPEYIKAIYATGWSSGSSKKVDYFLDLIKKTELNAIVIDIKDFSGFITYNTGAKRAREYNAIEERIPRINSLIKKFHDEGVYVIARQAVFQDPRLALARPDLALKSSTTQKVWKDKLGLAWIDPSSREAWDYNIEIAKDALSRGFDEINFDYVRFASDGELGDIIYPFWDQKISRREIMRRFFEYLRLELKGNLISADLFGLVTVNNDDLGIGQYLENALPYFDYIAPMVYPSHYHSGFLGYKNPAKFPYEIINYSMSFAVKRATAKAVQASTTPIAKFRPWLQDFDLGADYNADLIRKEIQAVYDSASTTPEYANGWMLWNPNNVYTKEALIN